MNGKIYAVKLPWKTQISDADGFVRLKNDGEKNPSAFTVSQLREENNTPSDSHHSYDSFMIYILQKDHQFDQFIPTGYFLEMKK